MVRLNDILRRGKEYVSKNPDKARSVIDKVENAVDKGTKGKYTDQVRKAGDAAERGLGVEGREENRRPQNPGAEQSGPEQPGDQRPGQA